MIEIVEASLRQVCEVCGSDGATVLSIPETRIEAVTDCLHCGPARVPIVKVEREK